jgi:hypothetical protein
MKKLPKCAKIRIANEEHSRFVQSLLFKRGFSWCDGTDYKHLDEPYLFFDEGGYLSYTTLDEEYFVNHSNKEVFTQDLLMFPKPIISLRLNDNYEAKIDSKNRIVSVGCQKIDVDKVVELYKLLESNDLVKK